MKAEWFVTLGGKQAGPYTLQELLGMKELTPDTLAWKKGMLKWQPIREIPELKDLFKEVDIHIPDLEVNTDATGEGAKDIILDFPQADPPLFFWLIVLLILIAYALLQIFK